MKKSFMGIVIWMITVLLVAGCAPQAPVGVEPTQPSSAQAEADKSPATESAAASAPISFHYAFLDEPPGIDPTISQGSTQSTIYATLYEGLVTVDETGNIIPGAAERWEVSPDGTEYTFYLRDGLKWSDGKDLTARDFEYAWLRALQPETASTYSWFVEMFIHNGSTYAKGEVGAEEVGVKALDDKTLSVKLNIPAAYFLQALLTGVWLPVRQDIVEADPETWPFNAETAISNGPFKLTEYKIGSYITAEKNPYYWDADSVTIDQVRFSFITDANTAYSAFITGDVDGIAGVPTAELVNLLATDDRLHTYDRLSFSFLRLNTRSEGLSNPMVRRAISLAFDRKGYLDGLGNITAQPALGSVPGGLILDGKDFRTVSGDNGLAPTAQVEAARALLAQAGYPDGAGLPIYHLHCADNRVKDAEILQQMLLTNLGIQTEIKPVDSKLNFPMMVEGKYDIAFGGWGGDYNHPMTFLELFTSTAYDNATGWANAEYDDLIAKARVATNEAEALDLMVKAEHILIEESPIVPVSVPSGAMMMQNYVSDWFISPADTLYIARAAINQ